MSLNNAANLLRTYNKGNPYTKTVSATPSAVGKIATPSYANMYDALYDKFSRYKNFDINMWRDALKQGEQDQYLAFLEQNKNTTLSDQFYDNQYYDYETMMLEMYLPFADKSNTTEVRTTEIFDPMTNEWVEQEIGQMSDYDYIKYQIDSARQIKQEEIARALEQEKKDNLNWFQKLGHDTNAVVGEFTEGVVSGLAGIADFVIAPLYATSRVGQTGDWFDAYVEYFGEKGLTAAEKATLRAALDEYERMYTHFRDIDGNVTGVGTYFTGVANSIGMMVPAIVANIATGGAAMVGSATFYSSIFSNSMYETATNPLTKDSPSLLKIGNVAIKTGVEAVIEYGLSKVLGGTVQNQLLGINGKVNIAKEMTRWTGLKYLGKSALQEGFEEFAQDFSTNLVDQFTDLIYEGYGNNGVTIQTLIDSFCVGMLSSLVMSGGQIGLSGAKSSLVNRAAKRADAKDDGHRYNKEWEYGPGDIVIETEEGVQKLTGANKLYFSQILSDFRSSIDELKNAKFNTSKNIKLAQEVYSGIGALAQFYSSFSNDRIKACEMLLDRVVKAEHSIHGRAGEEVSTKAKTFANAMEMTFAEMVGDVGSRKHKKKVHDAVEKNEEKLKKDGVTQTTGAMNTNGETFKKDPTVDSLEKALGKPAMSRLEELSKEFEWVFTTDGHGATEEGDILFVSEAWLQNYTTSDIYKYLEQTRVLEALTTDKTLTPMVKKLIAFDKEFTGQTDVDAERALMDFLFNESVYQGFLLSEGGKNAHEYKQFIFQLHEIVRDLANRSKYHQQLFKGKQAQVRINLLNQIYEQIKNTMRKPTIKAIINWRFDPQIIGADSILLPIDREFINLYEQHRRVIANAGKKGKDSSAHENLLEDIIRSGKLSAEALGIIKKSRDGTATLDEEIEARALLDEADRRMTVFDFEISPEHSYYLKLEYEFTTRYFNIDPALATAEADRKSLIEEMEPYICDIRTREISDGLANEIDKWYEYSFDRGTVDFTETISLLREYVKYLAQQPIAARNARNRRQTIGLGALTLPYQVASLIETGDIARAQFVTDKLDEFENMYGISARQMIMGDLSGMSIAQRNQLTQDMEVLDVDNTTLFVTKKLESMLGDKYIVVPTHKQMPFTSEDVFNVMPFDTVYADVRDTFAQMKNEIIEWYQQIRNNVNRMSESKAEAEIERATEIFSDIVDRYSDLSEYMPADARTFAKDWFRVELSADKAKDVIKWLIAQEKRINTILDDIAEVIKYDGYGNTSLQDFAVVKSIPIDALVVQDILDEDVETRNLIFQKACESGELVPQNKIIYIRTHRDEFIKNVTTNIPSADRNLINEFLDATIEKLEMLQLRFDFGEQMDYFLIRDEISSLLVPDDNGYIISAFTGEIVAKTDVTTLETEVFDEDGFNLMQALYDFVTTDATTLSDFINIDKFPIEIREKLENVTVSRAMLPPNMQGFAARNQIVINVMASDQFGTLVHEFNHILQDIYDLPLGFSDKTAVLMPDFLHYVTQHYPIYVRDVFINAGHPRYAKRYTQNTLTEQDINGAPKIVKEILSFCAYSLVQGELWARAYTHNGKPVHGFAEILTNPNTSYLLSPDGKTRFKVPNQTAKSASTSVPKISPELAGSALDVAVQKLFMLKWRQEREGYTSTSRNTYHSYLTKDSSTRLLYSILRSDISVFDRAFVRLSDVIKDPQRYLAPEILVKCNGDFSEGNVFYRLKEYVENNFEGISLDINDRQEYIWVDDNAFDDLLLTSMQARAESTDISLVKQFEPHKEIPLSKFYSQAELNRLGIDPNAYVLIDPTNGGTETIFDKDHRHGAIILDVDESTTDASFIDDLNHEFRHLLQYYNGFATGFTADFKVTKEMRDDVKKHLPELFKNQEIVKWAKKVAVLRKVDNYEDIIVQRYVYYSTSGELMAYAFKADELYAKPVFVNLEAGNPTIFMSWYDAKTGEGRHRTDFLAMRADNTSGNKKGISFRDMPQVEKKEKDTRPRAFSKRSAKGTNLEYFVKSGQRNQLDPVLRDFVRATTGREDKLPPELMARIYDGTLTMDAFYKWFREVKDIDEFTFKFINKYIFKNDYVTSMKTLDKLLKLDVQLYWALYVLMLKKGAPFQSLLAETDVDRFRMLIESADNGEFWKEVLELSKNFDNYEIEQGEETYKEHIGIDEDTQRYMRVYLMNWFNGTPAGAFKSANSFRKTLFRREDERRGARTTSFDQTLNDEHSDDKDMTRADMISEGDVDNDALTHYGNDILAIYEARGFDTDITIDTIVSHKLQYDIEKLLMSLNATDRAKKFLKKNLENGSEIQGKIDKLEKKTERTEEEETLLKNYIFAMRKYKQLIKDRPAFRKALMAMPQEEIAARYMIIRDAQTMGTFAPEVFDVSRTFAHKLSDSAKTEIAERKLNPRRADIQRRIKKLGKKLIDFVDTGAVKFTDLPEEMQDFFEYKIEDGKTPKLDYKRNEKGTPVIYAVGRGRAKLPGETDPARFNYVPKHDITKGNEAFRHDTTQIRENEMLLRAVIDKIETMIAEKKAADELADKTLKNVQRENARLRRELKKAIEGAKRPENSAVTEIEVKAKKKKTSDTPNNFQIISSIEMPEVLRNLFDVSFNEMADTRVQFASKDEAGNLYDKETMKPKDFDSRVKHEVANWDAFYEAVRPQLLALTRTDVLNIVDFFERGAVTIDGPAGKLSAFEIYLLGYFVDAARTNTFGWDLSSAQIEHLEGLFEDRASEAGSALNAVNQMKKVIDPLKRVRQRMFEDWITVSDHDTDQIIKDVDALQKERDADAREEKAKALNEKFEAMQEAEFEARAKSTLKFWKKDFWTKDNFGELYDEVKAFRYLAMLSSPVTWIRNQVSNVLNWILNHAADAVGGIIFTKKGYRKEQWNLSKVKVSDDVKAFIDEHIKGNPVFDSLYNMSSKYDERQRKKITGEKELFVSLITSAIEQKYAAEHRFDRATLNAVSKFVNAAMTDGPFIKLATSRYFSKILTLEVAKGNVNLAEGLSNKALNLFAEAVILANQEYMHKRSFLADWIDKARGDHPYVYEVVSLFQPFLNSSFNWFAEALKYTPVGLINACIRMSKLEQQIDKIDKRRKDGREMVTDSRVTEFLIRRDVGKGVVGLLLSMLGLFLGLAGMLRIDEDDDKFYVIAGDVKVDISTLFASSSVLIGASISQGWIKQADGNNMSLEEILDRSVGYIFDGFFINDLLERHRWDNGIYDAMLTETESVLRSFVPQIWQLGIRVFNNDKIRYNPGMKGMWERWLNSFIPGQPGGNRVVNPYTGEVQAKYALPIIGELLKSGFFFGPKFYWYEPSDTERLCRSLGVNKNELTGELTVNGKKHTLDREELNVYYGQLNNSKLAKIKSQKHTVEMPDGSFSTLSWDKMSDIQKTRVINKTMTQNADIAKIYIWTQHMGHKFYASDSLWQTLREQGITQNVYKGDKGFVE